MKIFSRLSKTVDVEKLTPDTAADIQYLRTPIGDAILWELLDVQLDNQRDARIEEYREHSIGPFRANFDLHLEQSVDVPAVDPNTVTRYTAKARWDGIGRRYANRTRTTTTTTVIVEQVTA